MLAKQKKVTLANRFRGFLPVVIDVETSGLDPSKAALLELAAVTVTMDEKGQLRPDQTYSYHVEPYVGAFLDPAALAITGIKPDQLFRYAIPEKQALHRLFLKVREQLKATQCQRAVLVGHNAWFDLSFLQAAVHRAQLTDNPFHSFTTLDTASLSAVALGETVLARAVRRAHIEFDVGKAHSAKYDAERTAELFCYIVNHSNYHR